MKQIIWQIVGLTVIFIFSFTGLMMAGMFMAIKGISSQLISGFFAAGFFAFWSVKTMIRLNKKYKELLMEKMREKDQFITEWTCTEKDWQVFLNEQRADSVKDLKMVSMWIAAVVSIVLFFGFNTEMRIAYAIMLAIVSFLSGWAMLYFISRFFSQLKYKRHEKFKVGQVTLSKSAVQINHQFFDWSQRAMSLMDAQINESFKCPVIQLSIRVNAGNRSTTNVHPIPIPADRLEEARKIVDFYKSTLS